MALFRLRGFSPSAALHPEILAVVCTPVTLARKQLKSNPRLRLAWSVARHSFSAVNEAQASVAFELAGKTPCACSLGVSFFSTSLRLPFESTDFFESLFTHLMGFSEWELCESEDFELPCAAVDAPAPAGPCATARSAPTVMNANKPTAVITTPKNFLFMFTSRGLFGIRSEVPHRSRFPVGHSVRTRRRFPGRYSPNRSRWPLVQVGAF